MGLHGQNAATISALPLSLISTQRSWTAHRHRHPLTAGQTSERAVIDPLHINPERVDLLQRCATTDLNRHPSSCGLLTLDDVCGPIAIRTGLLIGMIGLDSCGDGETGKISLPSNVGSTRSSGTKTSIRGWGLLISSTPSARNTSALELTFQPLAISRRGDAGRNR